MKTPSPVSLPASSSVSDCLTTPPPPPPPADDDPTEPAIAGIATRTTSYNDASGSLCGVGPTTAEQGSTGSSPAENPPRHGPVAARPAARPGAVIGAGIGVVSEKDTATTTTPSPTTQSKTIKKAAEALGSDDLFGLRGPHDLHDPRVLYHGSSLPPTGTVEEVAVAIPADGPAPDGTDGNGGNDGNDSDAAGRRNRVAAVGASFLVTARRVLLRTWLNVFLVFVPAGIVVKAVPGCPPAVVFSLNAIAIVPLAGLLGFATEAVAHRMGDSIGALLNVTFGNAVELIIFIALVKNEIRIVQASLLGSILANLLLILGMGFLLGGLRFREQMYNSTVTQMSACLLSLSVISLVLPTAFHASFSDAKLADSQSLKISRGTSVVLLLVYGIYLLFQLKSHAYMYESTPQHIIDEEATPGPAAAWLDSSTSDDSATSSSDSDSSGHSRDTMRKRMRRVIRRRRKSSVASLDTAESFFAEPTRMPSFSAATAINDDQQQQPHSPSPLVSEEMPSPLPSWPVVVPAEVNTNDGEEVLDAGRHRKKHHRSRRSLRHRRRNRRRSSNASSSIRTNLFDGSVDSTILEGTTTDTIVAGGMHPGSTSSTRRGHREAVADGETRRVDFALVGNGGSGSRRPMMGRGNAYDNSRAGGADAGVGSSTGAGVDGGSTRRAPLNLRAMSLRPVAKSLAPSVFTQPVGAPPVPAATAGPIPRVRYGIRRTNSLPDRLNQQMNQQTNQQRTQHPYQLRPPGAMLPSQIPARRLALALANKTAGSGRRGIGSGGGGGGGGPSGTNTHGDGDNYGDGTRPGSEDGHGSADDEDSEIFLSRKAAVVVLLLTTGLVAVCAEFMVDSINGLVATSAVNEVFIGLIILPIVGNAAEHVTAVTVAMKNKMDLAIGVAVGSSIQIALFMTPLVVILGWCMGRAMTLYFTLFETVCLFVSAFIVNFLVLDGRSNYLEGALLCATYVIIGLAAFFYPRETDASSWG